MGFTYDVCYLEVEHADVVLSLEVGDLVGVITVVEIKSEMLDFLKEVIYSEVLHKLRIERILNHLCSSNFSIDLAIWCERVQNHKWICI